MFLTKHGVLLIISILFFNCRLYSQILNIEQERIKTDTTGWSGSSKVSGNIFKNTKRLFEIDGRIHLQYKTDRSLYLSVSEYNFLKTDNNNFSNNGFVHFRYNYKIFDNLTYEGFIQSQFNKVLLVKFRQLAGTGIRVKIIGKDEFRLYGGASYMFEYEALEGDSTFNRNHRLSSYLSFTIKPNPDIRFINTAYYQPLFANFNDYRIALQTDFVVKIIGNFTYALTIKYLFDSQPPDTVPNEIFSIKNGIMMSF